ncbi:hypothetical protein [Poriferisphaera sp. WC338]|uniref:hypothetical protein n=1 Tax=Poriferisphaera sp. WC338 TaxID=3425129 RepID=UPI003D8173EE
MLIDLNIIFGWVWMLAGIFVGGIVGMFFAKEDFMGGYNSWRRRLVRLGHIAFIGMAIVNIGFALCIKTYNIHGFAADIASIGFFIGGVGMPVICLLSAWKQKLRHAFAIPVAGVSIGSALTIWMIIKVVLETHS